MLDKIIGYSGSIIVFLNDRDQYVIDIDRTYGGQTSLSTLGTVTIGNWRAAIIESAFGGTGVDNHGFTITIGGNLCTEGPITFECEDKEGSIVSIPRIGRLVNRSEALDPEKNLKDISSPSQAYDYITPVVFKGDFVVFNGKTNCPMGLGKEGEWLAVDHSKPLGMDWRPLPHFYCKDTLSFEGRAFYAISAGDKTTVQLADNLESLARIESPGILVVGSDRENGPYVQSRELTAGPGISIYNTAGEGHPYIAIDPEYKGQKSIDTVGHIRYGYWGGDIVDTEFGGTGHLNKHGIKVGGELETECNFSVAVLPGATDSCLQFLVGGPTQLFMPMYGTLATEENSLQGRHNLGDVENKLQAFSNISPTKQRGDLIVRGYGDYDTVLRIGAPGQMLTVVKDEPGLMEWTDPLTVQDVDIRIQEHIEDAIADLRKANKPVHKTIATLPLEEVLEAILMQFDHMKQLGKLQPIAKLKDILDMWTRTKTA